MSKKSHQKYIAMYFLGSYLLLVNINIGSGNGLVVPSACSGTKPLSKPMLTKITDAVFDVT